MNELYDQTIEFRGRLYKYDPDRDCFYPEHTELSTLDRWLWLAVILVLATICAYFEFVPIR